MLSRILSRVSVLDLLIAVVVLLLVSGVTLADDKAKRDRDAAAAVAMQLAIADRETAPAPKAAKPTAPMPKTATKAARDKSAAAALQSILAAPNYSYVAAPGWHVHECPVCGSEWSHSDANKGDLNAHRCPNPNCNGMSLDPSKRNTRIEERRDSPEDDEPLDDEAFLIGFTPGPPCPNGQCPTYSRSVVIIRNAHVAQPMPPAVTKTVTTTAPVVVTKTVYSTRRDREPVFNGPIACGIRGFFGRLIGR